ncbi:MAG: hypothetical protein IJS96_03070 [Schwartzia sp.]|nr:hypothetical protein [Schwartzia sp. (in: firmicutes)]
MLTEEAKRLMAQGRLTLREEEGNGVRLLHHPEAHCGGKITVRIGRDAAQDEVINGAARRIAEVDDVFRGKLSPRLEKVMMAMLHVSVADVDRMTGGEIDTLYEWASDCETDLALAACGETETGASPEAEDAAHIADWLRYRLDHLYD